MTPTQPTLLTSRLILRPFTLADAATVQRLAGEREVAAMTLSIPHPYTDGIAAAWIATHSQAFQTREAITFAVVRREDNTLCGCVSLRFPTVDAVTTNTAELGYWIGKPYWGKGYCTEATSRLLQYGFEDLGVEAVYASHFVRNPASGRVMRKLGLHYRGFVAKKVEKWGNWEDVYQYDLTRTAWQTRFAQPSLLKSQSAVFVKAPQGSLTQ